MDPLGVGDTHYSKKKANNPMFSHTASQGGSNTPPRNKYYDSNGVPNAPNKYTMAMSNPSQNGKLL